MKSLLVTTALILASAAPVAAHSFLHDAHTGAVRAHMISVSASATGAKDFIVGMSDNAISFLDNEGMTQEQKEAAFKKLLRSSFDMSTIGRFALGTYWNGASTAQRNEYQKLFEAMIVRVYSARFNEYNGQRLDVGAVREEGKDVVVTSYIVPPSGSKIRVDWRVRNRGQGYKIVDVIIEGVSMAMTQRADFSSVIQRGGGDIQVLIDHLKKG
jgi:phospholipid transport system substrate-binding protein